MKPQGKAREEDQEQQDPMEFLQSDEEEEAAAEEEKGNQAGGAAKRRLQEQRERLHGALALIELANNLSAWTRLRRDPGHPLTPPSSYLQSFTAFLPYVLSLEIAHNLRSLTSLVYSVDLWNQT